MGQDRVRPDQPEMAMMESVVTVSGNQAPLTVQPGRFVLAVAAERNMAVVGLEKAEFENAPNDFA